MGGHDHLAMACYVHPTQPLEEFELAVRRQRRFRFVEDEDPLLLASLCKEPQETFTVRMRQVLAD
jgi:hypothetical protein